MIMVFLVARKSIDYVLWRFQVLQVTSWLLMLVIVVVSYRLWICYRVGGQVPRRTLSAMLIHTSFVTVYVVLNQVCGRKGEKTRLYS